MDNENDQIKIILKELSEKINLLETRVSGLEAEISVQKTAISNIPLREIKKPDSLSSENDDLLNIDNAEIEANVVEYGFSWFGSLILIIGLSFLMTLVQNKFNGIASAIVGGISIVGVYFLSNYLKKSFSYLSFMLVISSHILLYFLVLHLYFFTNNPLIPVKIMVVILLIGVTIFNLYQAIKRNSEFMAIFGLIFIFATALISDQTHMSLSIISLSSIISFYLFIKQKWSVQLIFNLILVYLLFIIWFFGNPMLGHPFVARQSHEYSMIYLFLNGLIFASITLIPNKTDYKLNVFTSGVIINSIAFSLVVLMMVAAFMPTSYSGLFLIISALCLAYSILLKFREESQFIESFYACLGFMALSAAVYGYYKFPDAYFWLTIQSLMVLIIALWFRSRLIVIMNTILYIVILLGYLSTTQSMILTNFTFAIVALFSARIINWQKTRLALETEFIRNTYLFALFVMLLFALYKAIPKEYVSISWTIAAIAYFAFSIILKNIKYRYLSIFTLISSALCLFIISSLQISIVLRIISFLFIAVIAIGIAFYYMKNIKKQKVEEISN